MAILKLFEYPDKILTQKAEPVVKVDADLEAFLNDMLQTMYADRGVGLAAPQVGVLKRVIVIDPFQEEDENGVLKKGKPMFLVNPEIISHSEETIFFCEGCLSVPGQRAEVERFEKVTVRYLDEKGVQKQIEAEGYVSVVLQHEIDHLDGILYIDHLSRLKRNMLLKKLEKMRASQKAKE
ncbi:MAG: peptide deformylase [Alphaproteobacteria bacterium]|nr:peptide deformylase [Alphaproteobacteria bacterium]